MGAPPEKRVSSTRSRTGCVGCRSKRVRCDEKKPSCSNCWVKNLPCSYVPTVPLRERRAAARPGEQTPWVVQKSTAPSQISITAKPGSDFLDPFDVLPIKMPLKSKELLQYFLHAGTNIGTLPINPNDCVASATRDPNILQNTMLVSALHYTWNNKGDLALFEPTFLLHKIESIKQINNWLASSSSAKDVVRCAKYISTHCIVECCLGNFAVAESHLNGLTTYLFTKQQDILNRDSQNHVDLELANRCLIIASSMIHSTKSRISTVLTPETIHQEPAADTEVAEVSRMMLKMHLHEVHVPELRLRAFRMIPFLFGSIPSGREPKDINMYPAILLIREMTELIRQTSSADAPVPMPWYTWNSGGPSRLLYTMFTGHIQSFSDKIPLPTPDEPVFVSAWSGFFAAVGFYLITVPGVCNRALPPERKLHYLKINILKRDLQKGVMKFESTNTETRNLWFWKAFVGALSTVYAQSIEFYEGFETILDELCVLMKCWVKITGIQTWADARRVLRDVVWPAGSVRSEMCESLWQRVNA
ncbi:hypothetical protein FIE12Z_10688 [Fusarium flagelliforme]|uniref:Zn(2)-C6 fungal-type domain-containing protein n=1 Tax=Fusarium flagelliforme TaxID=2675880 RepID=A0A395MB71_9HYPO|nr:hypothetical protein FIE12Z_10688 [Fusarium flagelliforme]